jgi:hypothetical protein
MQHQTNARRMFTISAFSAAFVLAARQFPVLKTANTHPAG